MTIKNHHRTTRAAFAIGAATLFAAYGAGATAVSAPDTEVDTVIRTDLYCIVRELSGDDQSRRTFEEICVYDGHQPDPYPYDMLRERVEQGDVFTSTARDGSTRTGTCIGEYDVESQRVSERDAGVLPYTPAALQGHELCTFTGTLTGSGERAGQELVEEGSMYQASETTFRGHVIVRPAR